MPVPPIYPVLFKASREKEDPDLMLQEWVVTHRERADYPENCPCGQLGIVQLCYIRNILTGVEMFVGNECVLHIDPDAVGLCSVCKLYPAVSHTALMCHECGHHSKKAPTGIIRWKGKYQGFRYDDPALKGYAVWAMKPENRKFIDPHYLAWLELQQSIRIRTAVLEARRRRLALALEEKTNVI